MNELIKEFKEEHCKNCNNKNSDLCEIKMNVNNRLQCAFEKSEFEYE